LIEIVAAPVLMAAPFVLGFAEATGVVTFALGALLMGLAISTVTDQRTIPPAPTRTSITPWRWPPSSPDWSSESPLAIRSQQLSWSGSAPHIWR
jgi:hypothetical protein